MKYFKVHYIMSVLFQFCCRILTKQVIPLCSSVDCMSSIFTCSHSIVSVTCQWMKILHSLLPVYILSIFISVQLLLPPFLVLSCALLYHLVPCHLTSLFHLKCYNVYFEYLFPIYSFIMAIFLSKTLFLMLSHLIFSITTCLSLAMLVLVFHLVHVHVELLNVKFSLTL